MTATRKRRQSFIGKDPVYTDAPSVAAPRPVEAAPPSAAAPDEQARKGASADAPPAALPPAELPEPAPKPSAEGTPTASATPRPARSASETLSESVELYCKVWLDDGIVERLDRLSERSGLGRDALLRYLRGDVVEDFRATLADQDVPKPLTPTPRRGRGPSVQIRLRLSGLDLEHARRRLDPLDLGRAALVDQAQATIVRLYRERLARMSERLGIEA